MLPMVKSQIDMRKVESPKNIIVDCDAGLDDALALIYFLANHVDYAIKVKAVTCVNGNTNVENVVKNVFRILDVCECQEIPVYRGAYSPLLNTPNAREAASEEYHGSDGFGDVYIDQPDTNRLQKEHAVYALHKITSEDPGNISVICLGPLTNIAMTIKMYPEFLNNVKEFFVMGGNSAGQGNITSQAEFNFYTDPESAHIVLNDNTKPLWLLPWETCLKSQVTHDWRKDVLGKIDIPCMLMLNNIENNQRGKKKEHFVHYIACDAFLAGIVLIPSMAKEVVPWHADVELAGNRTRGQVVLDHMLLNKPNINLINNFDSEMFKEMLVNAMYTLQSDYYFLSKNVNTGDYKDELLCNLIFLFRICDRTITQKDGNWSEKGHLTKRLEKDWKRIYFQDYIIEETMDLMAFVPYSMTAPTVQHEPRVEHVCEVSPKEDPLTKVISGSSTWSRIRRWFLGTRIISRRHPLTLWCLKSTRAIDYEISHHLKSHPYMIHPFSSFRIFWESAMTLFIIATLLITPVFLTFYFDECAKWYIINHAIDAVLICDIIIWFFTGHYDSHTQLVILDPRVVAKNYLQGFFLVDTLSVLPLEFLIVLTDSMWYLASLNLLKILWIRTVIVYSRKLYHVYRINFHLYKIAEIFVIVVIAVHWAACMEYYLPLMIAKITGQKDPSWIQSPYMEKRETKYKMYLTCINRAIIALIGAAQYLDVSASEDIIYNLILSVFGFLGFIYLLARILQLMTTFHSTNKRHLKLIQQLQQYMRYKELPYFLQRRLLSYYNYRNKKGFERDKIIINHVSPHLREELLLHNYLRLLNNVRLFGHLPQLVVTQLIGAVYSEIFMPNDTLVRAGTRGDALYFIASGTVAVYNNIGKEIYHMEDGAYFGELALVIEDEHWIASVIATENCDIYILSRVDFQHILAPYPELLAHLQNVALARLEQTPLLKKAHESDAPSSLENVNISSIKAKRKESVVKFRE